MQFPRNWGNLRSELFCRNKFPPIARSSNRKEGSLRQGGDDYTNWPWWRWWWWWRCICFDWKWWRQLWLCNGDRAWIIRSKSIFQLLHHNLSLTINNFPSKNSKVNKKSIKCEQQNLKKNDKYILTLKIDWGSGLRVVECANSSSFIWVVKYFKLQKYCDEGEWGTVDIKMEETF